MEQCRTRVERNIVSTVVALAAMAGGGVSYFNSTSDQANKDPKDVLNLGKSAP